ncbi:MAG TPA: 50S ribosomal protein L18 [Candidatus Acidoferrum sp.]|nr:50S ribosomal protein L18 [Candidatus Acidoferrum sp.]
MEEALVAKGSDYCVPYRRRNEGKTDYKARRAFVVSGKPRLVVRHTLNNVTAQIVTAKPNGDEVLVSAHSRELNNYEWRFSGGNIPSAYLTGLLCGVKAKAKGVEEVILDIGLRSPSKGARVFAVLKGVLDAGVTVPHSEEKLPDQDRIEGKHIAQYAESLASTPETYQSKFSKYLKQNLSPEGLPKAFVEAKKEIMASAESGGAKK